MMIRVLSGAAAMVLLIVGALVVAIGRDLPSDIGMVLIGLAGLVGILMAIRTGKQAWYTARVETVPAATETLVGVPIPGDELDQMLRLATLPTPYVQKQRELRRRVVTLVRTALVVYEGLTTEAATEAMENGTWTADEAAAGYVAGRRPQRSVVQEMRHRLSSVQDDERGVRETLNAVAGMVPGERFEEPDRGESRPLGDLMSGVERAGGGAVATEHWRGIGVIALVGMGGGIGLANPGMLVTGALGVGYAAYARIGGAPEITVEADREFSNTAPIPGDELEVTVSIQNTGEALLPDVRVADQLPDGVRVVDGNPRRSAVLPPDGTATLRYRIEAHEGTHRFEGVRVIARSLNGSYERATVVRDGGELTCAPDPHPVESDVPLRSAAARYVGQLQTDSGGEGIEFQSIREYRPGDRLSRIDWSRFARTEELTTVDFREEKAATIVMVIDAREAAYRAPESDSLHAVQRSIGAADRLVTALIDAGHRVGLASMSPVESCWQSPSAARTIQDEIRELLSRHPSLNPQPPTGDFRPFGWVEWFAARAPRGAQVILFSPLCDQLIEESIIRIEARGHPVTIVSPDPTTGGTLGREMARLDRQVTIDALRRRGIRVVDWPHDEPIEMSLERLATREHA